MGPVLINLLFSLPFSFLKVYFLLTELLGIQWNKHPFFWQDGLTSNIWSVKSLNQCVMSYVLYSLSVEFIFVLLIPNVRISDKTVNNKWKFRHLNSSLTSDLVECPQVKWTRYVLSIGYLFYQMSAISFILLANFLIKLSVEEMYWTLKIMIIYAWWLLPPNIFLLVFNSY